ncbi:MAG: 3'-5' exonuclease [Pseudomonadota bacterium]
MFTHLSLRLRIFLFFCLLALGAVALAAGAMGIGWVRAEDAPRGPFVTAFVAFLFLNTGLVAAVWFLFDKHVAKPIEKLATDLRLRAHSGVDREVDAETTRYLGDLAPAAHAISSTLSAKLLDTATEVAQETHRLQQERARLTALLTEIPLATVLLNRSIEIVLYDAQAAGLLSSVAPPRLKAPLSDYFDDAAVRAAIEETEQADAEASVELKAKSGAHALSARLKALDTDGFMLMIDTADVPKAALGPRPLVYDFDLLTSSAPGKIGEMKLSEICFVAFDTETTGLSPKTDDVVQLGAVRVLNGRLVEGEFLDCYVNPGRPIPPASTKIHGVTDADVAGAPDFLTIGRTFHEFCRGAVIVAHNAPFDMGFLRRYEAEMGVAWDHPVLDTVLLSAVVFGITEAHSLDALCARLGITIPDALRHTALGDARATAEALVTLIPLLENKGIASLADVVGETGKHGRLLQDLN